MEIVKAVTVVLSPEFREKLRNSGWGMFEPEGSRMVADTFIELVEVYGVAVERTFATFASDFADAVVKIVESVVKPIHGEVSDTAVRDVIYGRAHQLFA